MKLNFLLQKALYGSMLFAHLFTSSSQTTLEQIGNFLDKFREVQNICFCSFHENQYLHEDLPNNKCVTVNKLW